ncbi:hypothetical protein HNQ93_001485 [Hymenobacter luteus]|uniref:Outer membrane protein assembly factor BamE n=2 Tax=Hymenobacter TaxID=89966 RepID=A0A7W9T178_9BACT|nr:MULTISPECIES: hypothetical protein [Hymenobacter]MBB4601154.1 hypothetical protein [Hymenobacter latericoloratus]MBB6058639.1 hypothetical protein [Hymenobacter luteus]
MKLFICIAPFLLSLAACQSSPTTPAATEAAAHAPPTPSATPEPSPEPTASANPERIQDGLVTVNGQPNKELTVQELKRQMGRPDSVEKGAVECGSQLDTPPNAPAGDWWYYGNTLYEVSGTQALLHSFDVTTGQFKGKLGKLTLDQNTTLEDVRRLYPVATKQAEEPEPESGELTVNLPFEHNGELTDASLNLVFKNGRLQEVEFFFPC